MKKEIDGADMPAKVGDQSDNERERRASGKLEGLRTHTFMLWSMTRADALVDSEKRYKLAEKAAVEATQLWNAAVDAYTDDKFSEARAALTRAAELAKEWGDDSDERAALALLETVSCECGRWSGEPCSWEGPKDQTVIIEFMPAAIRNSHKEGGTYGRYPHNGAERIRVQQDCAARILSADPEWSSVVA